MAQEHLHIEQAAASAPMAPIPSSPPILEWAQRLFNQDNVTAAFQFVKGPVLVASAALGGGGIASIAGILLGGLGLSAVGLYKTNYMDKDYRERLLKLYKHEVAAAVKKDESTLTVKDLDAAIPILGNDNALVKDLQNETRNKKFYAALGVVSTLVLTALTAGAALTGIATAGVLKDGLIIVASALIGRVVYDAVKPLVARYTGDQQHYNVNAAVARVADQVKIGPAVPEQLFSVFVEAEPALKQQIRQRYGDEYYDLSIMAKRDLIAQTEARYHTQALTKAINDQQLRPTALGFIAYGSPATHAASPAVAAGAPEPALAQGIDDKFRRMVENESPGRGRGH